MVIYVSGKITDTCLERELANIDIASSFGKQVAILGHSPIVPHTNCALDWNLPYERYMEIDLEILARCDAILMLPNWTTSKGAKRELELAKRLKKLIFMGIEELRRYNHGHQTDNSRED